MSGISHNAIDCLSICSLTDFASRMAKFSAPGLGVADACSDDDTVSTGPYQCLNCQGVRG